MQHQGWVGKHALSRQKIPAAKGFSGPIPRADLSSKEKARTFLGLHVQALRIEKKNFLEQTTPEWLRQAKE